MMMMMSRTGLGGFSAHAGGSRKKSGTWADRTAWFLFFEIQVGTMTIQGVEDVYEQAR